MTISSESVMLLVGFTGGQIQLVDPIRKEVGKLYNEEVISSSNELKENNIFLHLNFRGSLKRPKLPASSGSPTLRICFSFHTLPDKCIYITRKRRAAVPLHRHTNSLNRDPDSLFGRANQKALGIPFTGSFPSFLKIL